MKEGFVKSFDGYEVYRYLWNDVENPIGIVQIFHGMAEHAKRYEDFAKFLNKNGYIVFANDHRAHGKTARGEEKLGIYKDGGPDVVWDTIMDEIYFSRRLIEKNKLPLYVLGHSYGSFICQAYIQKCNLYTKAIMCGSACMKNRIDVKLGKMIAKSISKRKGHDAPAEVIRNLTFGKYEKKFKDGSWLNTDIEKTVEYKNDPLCGKTMSAEFYSDFFSLFDWLYKPDMLKKVDKTKPIYLISGKQDPVGNMGKSVKKLFKMYASLEIEGIQMNLYDNARHEILNEKIKDKVYKDILKFLKKGDKKCKQ